MGWDARRGRQGRAGHGHDHPILSREYQLGPAIIPVAAGDSLESVLELVRTGEADDIVLDVDERSLLFISLQHLHRLEETAQAAGVHVAIASTNSKLRNAARVFGIDVVDPRAEPPPQPAPSPDPEFAPEEGVFADDEAPSPGMAGRNGTASTSPGQAELRAEPAWDPGEEPGPAEEDEWEEPAAEPSPPPPKRRPAREVASASGRLDPYGQPYAEADEAG